MERIDAHQHFWHYDPQRHSWITDEMAVIRKDFLPGQLAAVLEANRISGCVAVQADTTAAETNFLLQLAEQYAFIKGVVGWTDLCADDVAVQLEFYRQFPKLCGFRHILQAEDPAYLYRKDFRRGIAALQKAGFTYDILIYPRHLEASYDLVAAFPEMNFVIDHLAKPDIRHQAMGEWKKGLQALAAFPRVYCKLSGMVTEADWDNWTARDLQPYLDTVTDLFGPGRLMFGSDWPVCLVAAAYDQMMAPVLSYYSRFSAAEQENIFGNNARNFYQL
ncbi:MAG TPA: amidohydrolase family protein, partial [Sediminibacterium sp.]|nr:amidohydrolase family protein [Sediminibacterium sp.]